MNCHSAKRDSGNAMYDLFNENNDLVQWAVLLSY